VLRNVAAVNTDVATKGHFMHVSHAATPLERALLNEWNNTLAHASHDFDELGEFTGDEAIELIRRNQPPEERDRFLLRLLELERAGDEIAGKVILKSFLPLAFRLARASRSMQPIWRHSPTDATATTIGVLWQVIHTYPLHRTSSVSGNIKKGCIKLLEQHFYDTRSVPDVVVEDEILEYLVNGDAEPVNDPFHDLVTLFTWAIDNGTLTADEVRLLARIELAEGDPGEERERAADEVGISRDTLNRRVHRIRTKLMNAVCGDVQERVPYAPRRR
jgi:hypothetical protein